jgi:glycosyltransferase involved in cell wall biosynthesis
VKVAYYSPLPPERSGIADYSALLLPALERRVDVEVVRRGRTRPVAADVALYHVGNDPDAHGWIIDALRRRAGVVVLHDFVLHHLVAGLTLGRNDGRAYLAALERDAGIPGRLLAHGVLEGRVLPIWETRPDEFPLVDDVLAHAMGVIVHSRYVEARLEERDYEGPVWRIPHPAWPAPDVDAASVDGHPVFGCFGHVNATKRIPQLLEAFAVVRRRYRDARLLLVGPASPNFDVSRLGGDGVQRIDYVDEERLWSLIAACDACVSLRSPTMGETSGSAIRALSFGRPLVVSDLGWFSELPDDVALKVPVDEDEVPALAAALELLAASEATQLAMSAAAREYAERELGVDRVAAEYASALEEAAGGPIVADAVVREVALAAAEVGVEPGTPFAQELTVRLDELGFVQNGRPEPTAPIPTGALARIPTWGWLALLVLASISIRWWLAGRVVAPWIMVDELVYSELAKSFAATGHFLIRGEHHGAYGFLYPLMIAPAWRLFSSVPMAYAVAKVIGSVAMSLTAIPVYFLARRVLPPRPSLLAAALAVAVPSMLYTGTLMTETLFYPLFACVALALVLALERPTHVRQLLLLLVCLLAFLTRTQSVVLIPAIASAPILFGFVDRRVLRTVASFRLLYGILAAAVVLAVVVEVARGHSPYDVLGSYSVTGHEHYYVSDVLRWLLYHVAELDLYLGVIPFVALLVLAANVRALDRPARILVVSAVALTAWLVLEVATFASAVALRVEERNMFFVAPLFFIALLLWIERGLPRRGSAIAVCAAIGAALPGLLPYDRLIATSAESDTLALLPLWWLQEHIITLSEVTLVVVIAALVLAGASVLVPPRWAYVLPLLVAAWLVFANERVEDFDHGFPKAAAGGLATGLAVKPRDWIDRRVGRTADVAFVWPGPPLNNNALWENEFFNRSIRTVYDLGPPSEGDLPETPLSDQADGTLAANGRPVHVPYVLTAEGTHIAGRVLARDDYAGTELLRTNGTLSIAYKTSGLYPNDTWSGKRVRYTQYHCAGGTVAVSLIGDGSLLHRLQTVTGRSGANRASVTFSPALPSPTVLRLRLHSAGDGTCRATFTVAHTAVPALVEADSFDRRNLGARFVAFRYTPR